MAKSALKFKDSVAQYERIAAEVAARRFSGIYLLMGEESYFIDALSDQLAATILDEAARAFNQITVYGRDSEAGQVINFCRQMPMMGQYQVVILKEAQQLKGLDKLALYTQKPSPTTILVICHKEKNADKRSAFYKGCAANGTVLESVRPRDYEIAAWLQQFIRQKGFTIDPKALSMLTDHLGTDIAKISNEIRKLTVSLPEGTQRITDADIEANIGISKDFNNFELCKAVVTRDMARALMIADCAVLSDAPIVLIDEIENAGIHRRRALNALTGENKIVLMATHDPVLTLLADRRLVIRGGGISAVLEKSDAERAALREAEAMDARLMQMREALRSGARLNAVNEAQRR